MTKGKKILIGITASIAAYKTISLIRLLIKEGAEVRVVITPAAKEFVPVIVLSTLSKHKVYQAFSENDIWENHVELGRWADLFLIAPASCNTIAKMAHGICDHFLLATYLSATCPIAVAPAMDDDMSHHPATLKNINTLISYGVAILPSNTGELASGLIGKGRMQEPEEILGYLKEHFFRGQQFLHKNILISAGPTKEYLDPVRFLSNNSSGKMGYSIAEAFYEAGANVRIISGPVSIKASYDGIQIENVNTAAEMHEAFLKYYQEADYMILCAAVADYTPATTATEKIKKLDESMNIGLSKTKDILMDIGKLKQPHQTLVGFSLETNDGEKYAMQKLEKKAADYIILNQISADNPCFDTDRNEISIFGKSGKLAEFPQENKKQIAEKIVQFLFEQEENHLPKS